jgi:hypothetical protein
MRSLNNLGMKLLVKPADPSSLRYDFAVVSYFESDLIHITKTHFIMTNVSPVFSFLYRSSMLMSLWDLPTTIPYRLLSSLIVLRAHRPLTLLI